MNTDISDILRGWAHEPGKVTVRKVQGDDGREKIQLRLDLGLLQMETTGRPDGEHPHGCESLLAYYEDQLQQHQERRGDDKGFELDEKACELLRAEGVMYYHRYLAEFVLERYEDVQQDTMRNLRMMDLCNAYAAEPSDRYVQEQYRPYVVMMNARASVQESLRDSRPKRALASAKAGLVKIEGFYSRFGQKEHAADSPELAILRALVKDIESSIPTDLTSELRKKLQLALGAERYEEAASLRDQIHMADSDAPDSSGSGGGIQ